MESTPTNIYSTVTIYYWKLISVCLWNNGCREIPEDLAIEFLQMLAGLADSHLLARGAWPEKVQKPLSLYPLEFLIRKT